MKEEKNLKDLELIQDVPKRWTATYEMLERLIVIQEAVKAVLDEHSKREVRSLSLDPEDWFQAEELAKAGEGS